MARVPKPVKAVWRHGKNRLEKKSGKAAYWADEEDAISIAGSERV